MKRKPIMILKNKNNEKTTSGSKRKKKKNDDDDTVIVKAGDEYFPCRDLTKLFASRETISCAIENLCVPCAYKIGNFDVALDKYFSTRQPNQRPEMCPRLKLNNERPREVVKGSCYGYVQGMKILTCGDGDFSYSLALARLLFSNDNTASRTSSELFATSYESKSTLDHVYPDLTEKLIELERLGSTVLFNVDATKLENMFANNNIKRKNLKFNRIIWNFPCKAGSRGEDGQNDAMEENKKLISGFAESARSLLVEGGEIHICHKTKPPFNQWKLESVVLRKPLDKSIAHYEFLGRIVLDRAIIPPYVPRKALHKKSFPFHDACTYIFQLKNNDSLKKDRSFPITLNSSKNSRFVNITEDVIREIRAMHLEIALFKATSKGKANKKRRKF